jgi:hypothetical protein
MTADPRVPASGREQVSVLQRWQDSGAVWRVLQRNAERVTLGLFSCDGGEEMGRVTTSDPVVLEFVGDRTSSEE